MRRRSVGNRVHTLPTRVRSASGRTTIFYSRPCRRRAPSLGRGTGECGEPPPFQQCNGMTYDADLNMIVLAKHGLFHSCAKNRTGGARFSPPFDGPGVNSPHDVCVRPTVSILFLRSLLMDACMAMASSVRRPFGSRACTRPAGGGGARNARSIASCAISRTAVIFAGRKATLRNDTVQTLIASSTSPALARCRTREFAWLPLAFVRRVVRAGVMCGRDEMRTIAASMG